MPIIQIDTRQKMNKKHHKVKEDYFKKQGFTIVKSKMLVGDFCIPSNGSVVVDSKQNLQEVYQDLIQDHERFKREADLAVEAGITLYVLIEEPKMKCLEDVKKWENPRLHRYNKIKYMHRIGKWGHVPEPKGKPPVDNITLYKIMYTFAKKHGVKWVFCPTEQAGAKIVELLGANNERMEEV